MRIFVMTYRLFFPFHSLDWFSWHLYDIHSVSTHRNVGSTLGLSFHRHDWSLGLRHRVACFIFRPEDVLSLLHLQLVVWPGGKLHLYGLLYCRRQELREATLARYWLCCFWSSSWSPCHCTDKTDSARFHWLEKDLQNDGGSIHRGFLSCCCVHGARNYERQWESLENWTKKEEQLASEEEQIAGFVRVQGSWIRDTYSLSGCWMLWSVHSSNTFGECSVGQPLEASTPPLSFPPPTFLFLLLSFLWFHKLLVNLHHNEILNKYRTFRHYNFWSNKEAFHWSSGHWSIQRNVFLV